MSDSFLRVKLIVCLIVVVCSNAFAQQTFQKIYGGSSPELGVAGCESASGGYIFGGRTQSYGTGGLDQDMYLIRTNNLGDTLWTRTFGIQLEDRINCIKETSDGGIIISGQGADHDVVLIKTDANGNITWSRRFGLTLTHGGYSVIETNDGGFALTACDPDANSLWRAVLIKVDASGATEWIKMFDASASTYATGVVQTADSGFAVVGSVDESDTTITNDFCVFRTNYSGDVLWVKRFGMPASNDLGYSVDNIPGGFIMLGYSHPNKVSLIRMDDSGNILWSKNYPSEFYGLSADAALQVHALPGGGAFFAVEDPGVGTWCAYRTDSLGTIVTAVSYMPGAIISGSVPTSFPTQDGGFALVGSINNWLNIGSQDFLFIKTDSVGISGCNQSISAITVTNPNFIVQNIVLNDSTYIDPNLTMNINISSGGIVTTECEWVGIAENNSAISIGPNPFADELHISGLKNNSEIWFYDSSGKLLSHEFLNSENITFNTTYLNSGLYFLHISNAINSYSFKLLKVH